MPTQSLVGLGPGTSAIYGYPNSTASVSIMGSGYTVYSGPGSIPGTGYATYSGPGSIPGSGSSTFTGAPAPSVPCNNTALIAQLEALIDSLYDLIATLYPAAIATSDFIAAFSAPARMNPFTFVRFAWIKANPGKKLYPSLSSALAIKDMYLANGFDWSADPLILAFLP